ncbi:MAG: acyl carrier protein [Alphaproteobacteria bacterium]|nr:acyl carrier protein [Alphaproteobacteria bacterium]
MDSPAPTRDQVLALIYDAIDELNDTLEPDRRLARTPATQLFGENGELDSFGLVTLIVGVELRLGERFGVPVTLADERAMSQRNSPFRSVGTLADYSIGLLQDTGRV